MWITHYYKNNIGYYFNKIFLLNVNLIASKHAKLSYCPKSTINGIKIESIFDLNKNRKG